MVILHNLAADDMMVEEDSTEKQTEEETLKKIKTESDGKSTGKAMKKKLTKTKLKSASQPPNMIRIPVSKL